MTAIRKLVCQIFGHRWRYDRAEPGPQGWWWEWSWCDRCGALTRQLVASEEG